MIVVAMLSFVGAFAQETKAVADAVRYIEMNDGQVIAIPEKYILGEEIDNGVCTLSLEGGQSFVYSLSNEARVSDSYAVTANRLLPFGSTHEDNDQVFADVEATVTEVGDTVFVTANVPVIGKRLRPSFTMDGEATMWVGGVQQVSGQSSHRFTEPVVYTIAEPGCWMYGVEIVNPDDVVEPEFPVVPSEPEVSDGWVKTKIDISSTTTTNAPSNNSDYQGISNLWDDTPETYFHTTWNGGTYEYTPLYWPSEGGYYGDGVTEWPYVEIQLAEALQNFCISYTTSNQYNRFPQGWRITAFNGNTGFWEEIAVLDEALLPQTNLAQFMTPVYGLGEDYTAIRFELTKASYKNYMVIGDLSLYCCVKEDIEEEEGAEPETPVEPELPAGPTAVGSFKPFGRPCKVSVNYLTDNANGEYKIPTVYITFGDGVTWDDTQWIGQTLTDEEGNSYNTKEEWIKDCTFRLDGAGVWPDIDTVEGCEVRGRGNSSWSWSSGSKNPYRIKFPKKQKQAPFNLTEDRQWVFIANKKAGSMLTNSIAQKVASMVDGEAICHMIPIDLYINGHYRGSYCFTEKIGIADNSVAIDEATGCLLELDDYYDESYRFKDNTYTLPVNVKDPDFSEEDEERVVTFEGIQASVNNMTATLASGGDITQHIDMESWAKFWLVNDLVRNVETHHPKSCYLFNENPMEGGLWKFGPAWDFDWAFGFEDASSYYMAGATQDLFSGVAWNNKAGYRFYDALRKTQAAKRAYYKEWLDFVAEGRLQELMEYIEDYTQFAKSSFSHNNSADVWETDYTDYVAQVAKSQEWLKSRAGFIFNSLTKYDDIASGFVIPEEPAAPLQALLINDALHEDFAPGHPEYASVAYVRSIAAGKFGTITLPFAPDAESLENYAFYALAESGEGYVRFEEVAEPAANTPYLYTLREGGENTAITGGYTAVSLDVEPVSVDGWECVGSFTNHTVDASKGNYYAFSSARGEVNRVTQNLTVLPYRAYFKNAAASKSAFTVYVGGATCVLKISGDNVEGFGSECIYDVYGRRVINPVKGEIYIINGEKVMY